MHVLDPELAVGLLMVGIAAGAELQVLAQPLPLLHPKKS